MIFPTFFNLSLNLVIRISCSEPQSEDVARMHRRAIQKDLHDPDNHDGVITHLEPGILECEVKWALESITTDKASGHDGIPVG